MYLLGGLTFPFKKQQRFEIILLYQAVGNRGE